MERTSKRLKFGKHQLFKESERFMVGLDLSNIIVN